MMRDPHEFRGVDLADVYKQGRKAGTLLRRSDSIEFAYDPEYEGSGAAPVATTLPPGTEPVRTHAPGALPPFFSGLLPEGRRLTALRNAVKTSADDEMSLLLAVGTDTVGDVQVVPAGDEPVEPEPLVSVSSWQEVRFHDLFSASVGDPAGVDRVALPGVQDKVSARMINLPVAKGPGRFILKLDPPEFPHLVANEAFFLQAARLSGVEAAEAEVVHDADDVPGLLVRRFDRVSESDRGVQMLAMEDGCQVLGRYPADKYRLTSEAVVAALTAVCRSRPVAALALVRQVAFAYLSCNGDAHSKNFSVWCLPTGEWRVTPAYDIPSSYPYGDSTMALTVEGRDREDIGREHLLALGEAAGIRPRAVRNALDDLLERSDLWLERLDELPFDDRTLHNLRRAVTYRRDRLAAR